MNDSLFLPPLQCFRNLDADLQGLLDGQRTRLYSLRQGLADNQLHHQILQPIGLLQTINGRYVRVIQRGQHPRLMTKTRQSLRIVDEHVGQNLDGYVAAQVGVMRLINLTHPPRT